MDAKSHIENAAGIFYPPTRQSFTRDVLDMRRELSLASAGLSMDDADEAAILSQVFAADMQLRQMERASEKLADRLAELRGMVAGATVAS